MGDLVKKLKSQIGDDVCEIYSHEALFSEAADEITRLRAALADAQVVGFAAGVETAAKVAVPDERSMHADQSEYMAGARHAGWRIHGEIRALTPPDATAAAARVLLPIMEQQHIDYMTSLGRDPEKYTSEYSMVAKSLRSIAGATEMTDSTNAKLRELRERVAGLPCYDGDGDPAGPFDFLIFIRRQEVLSLIDAMIQEAGE